MNVYGCQAYEGLTTFMHADLSDRIAANAISFGALRCSSLKWFKKKVKMMLVKPLSIENQWRRKHWKSRQDSSWDDEWTMHYNLSFCRIHSYGSASHVCTFRECHFKSYDHWLITRLFRLILSFDTSLFRETHGEVSCMVVVVWRRYWSMWFLVCVDLFCERRTRKLRLDCSRKFKRRVRY